MPGVGFHFMMTHSPTLAPVCCRQLRLKRKQHVSHLFPFLRKRAYIIIIVTQGWVVNGVRRHAEPLGDNDPPQRAYTLIYLYTFSVRDLIEQFPRRLARGIQRSKEHIVDRLRGER
jgi:hypothetical protein